MKQPAGFVHPQFPTHVSPIYGLKQGPRAWFYRFSSFLLQQGFFCSQSDNSMFIFLVEVNTLFIFYYMWMISLSVEIPLP